MRYLLTFIIVLGWVSTAAAMTGEGCGEGSCADCHSITKDETIQLLGNLVDKVNSVDFAEVPGMWVADVEKGDRRLPVYIDFSKKFLVSGNVIRLEDRENLTQQRAARMNKVDVARIPLDDALLLGRATAKNRVIVFTDPECPYCKKLHEELKEVVKRNGDIAFLIKLFPLKMHPNAYDISKSIVCNKSMAMLELSFAGKPVPPPLCETSAVDQTIALAEDLGIRSTPTLVLADGLIVPGYKQADALLKLISENAQQAAVR